MKYYYAIIDGILQILKISGNDYKKEVLKAKNILKVTGNNYAVKNLFLEEKGLNNIKIFKNTKYEIKGKAYLEVLKWYCFDASEIVTENNKLLISDINKLKNKYKKRLVKDKKIAEVCEIFNEECYHFKEEAIMEIYIAIIKNRVREKIDEHFKDKDDSI